MDRCSAFGRRSDWDRRPLSRQSPRISPPMADDDGRRPTIGRRPTTTPTLSCEAGASYSRRRATEHIHWAQTEFGTPAKAAEPPGHGRRRRLVLWKATPVVDSDQQPETCGDADGPPRWTPGRPQLEPRWRPNSDLP